MYSFKNSLKIFNVRYYASTYIFQRNLTCVVERYLKPNLMKKNVDLRKVKLKSNHYHYKLIDCTHLKKWGEVKLILNQYIEGIGHKGEIVEVPRHLAHYELLPAQLAVFVTEENLELYKNDRILLENKTKVSKFAAKTRDTINNMVLLVPMNISKNWTLNKDHIRIALRYNKIMSENENIELPEHASEIKCDNKTYYKDQFEVDIKINDYTKGKLKCKIVPLDKNKLWEAFAIFNKIV